MNKKVYDYFTKISADDGKYLYDGHTVCKIVYVPIEVETDNWQEIDIDKGAQLLAIEEQEKDVHEAEVEAKIEAMMAEKEAK